jgi:hypothetical protein
MADRGFEMVARTLRNARAMGQLAVTMGTNEARRRLQPREEPSAPSATSAAPARSREDEPKSAAQPASPLGAIDDLIPSYDDLSASQVIALLGDVHPTDLGRIADHERRGRARRTILGRIEQLQSPGS